MAGEIVHVEFPAQDADRAEKFWNGLFGWSFQDSGMPEMDYRMAQTGERVGAAVYPSEERSGYPNYYFATDNIEAALGKVSELGGQAGEKSPVPGMGWFASCSDSEGNSFHLWQVDSSAG
jgi:predicted enzyme related to lactoylglutathione lyase